MYEVKQLDILEKGLIAGVQIINKGRLNKENEVPKLAKRKAEKQLVVINRFLRWINTKTANHEISRIEELLEKYPHEELDQTIHKIGIDIEIIDKKLESYKDVLEEQIEAYKKGDKVDLRKEDTIYNSLFHPTYFQRAAIISSTHTYKKNLKLAIPAMIALIASNTAHANIIQREFEKQMIHYTEIPAAAIGIAFGTLALYIIIIAISNALEIKR